MTTQVNGDMHYPLIFCELLLFTSCQKKSTRPLSIAISSDWKNIFQLFFHILVELRLKFPVCEIHVRSINRQEVDFFLFLLASSFSIFFRIFYQNHIPLPIIFPTSSKSPLSSNSIKSYRGLKKHCQVIWNRLYIQQTYIHPTRFLKEPLVWISTTFNNQWPCKIPERGQPNWLCPSWLL